METAAADRRRPEHVLVFHLCFFVLFSSGRLGSADAGAQLQASILLATTGRLSARGAPATGSAAWQQAPDGRYYEPHDIGNALLMLPAAWAGSFLSSAPAPADFDAPPLFSRVAVSLTYAVASALACWFIYRLFALWHDERTAFLLSVALPVTTMFGAYAKVAWDVMGACCGMCAILYYSALMLRQPARVRDALGLGAAFAVTCAFRYSMAPFLAIGVAAVLLGARRQLSPRHYLMCAAVAAGGLLPSLVYNYARTGSAFRPATASAAYLQSNNAMTGDMLHGVVGLLFAPNRGLIVFSPICVLLFALPFLRRRIAREEWQVISAIGFGALLYVLFIASLKNWGGSFAWGPRFLVPVVPVAFYAAALSLIALWDTWRRLLIVLLATSVLLSVAPMFVNWSIAIVAFPHALDQEARRPYQHAAMWQTLRLAIEGRPMPVPAAVSRDAERSPGARFPDLWTVRLMERSRAGFAVGCALSLALLLGAAASAARLLNRQQRHAEAMSARRLESRS